MKRVIATIGFSLFICYGTLFIQSFTLTSYSKEANKAISVQNQTKAIKINHTVKGQDVYVECIIPGFSFVSDGEKKDVKQGEGHIHVYLNGEKVKGVNQAAFILKDLPRGNHEIKLQFVHNNQKPYEYSKVFTVQIR